MIQIDPDIHSSDKCKLVFRYLCVWCWRRICWCKGVSDIVDEAITTEVGLRDPSTSDTGLCDDCWYGLGGGNLSISIEEIEAEESYDGEADLELSS